MRRRPLRRGAAVVAPGRVCALVAVAFRSPVVVCRFGRARGQQRRRGGGEDGRDPAACRRVGWRRRGLPVTRGRQHDGGGGHGGCGESDHRRQPPGAPLEAGSGPVEGGEDLVGVGGRGRGGWRRVGVVGACDANLEVIVGWPEPVQRLVEDLGESLGDLDRPGPAAGVVALDRLQRQLAAIGDLLLGELAPFAGHAKPRFPCRAAGGAGADHLVRAPMPSRRRGERGGADRRGGHSTSFYGSCGNRCLPKMTRAVAEVRELRIVMGHAGSLGEVLRAVREAKGWTQAEAGKRIGVAGNTISRWELGQLTPTGIQRARALEVYGLVDAPVLPAGAARARGARGGARALARTSSTSGRTRPPEAGGSAVTAAPLVAHRAAGG